MTEENPHHKSDAAVVFSGELRSYVCYGDVNGETCLAVDGYKTSMGELKALAFFEDGILLLVED